MVFLRVQQMAFLVVQLLAFLVVQLLAFLLMVPILVHLVVFLLVVPILVQLVVLQIQQQLMSQKAFGALAAEYVKLVSRRRPFTAPSDVTRRRQKPALQRRPAPNLGLCAGRLGPHLCAAARWFVLRSDRWSTLRAPR